MKWRHFVNVLMERPS